MKPATLAIVAVAALLAAGTGAGAWIYRSRAPEAAPTPVDPEPVPLELAATLPQISLTDRDGVPRGFEHWQGRSLIVNFWATWCAPCRREIPLLGRLQRDHGAEGFQVIGVAVDYRDKVLAYAEEMKIDYPLLIGEQEALDAAAAFGVEMVGLPFTVFSDAQGRIIAAHMGELTAEQADVILGAVRRVNDGAATPLQGRTEIEQGLSALATHPPAS
jgi:thiol-disulfide isomerase/thioredoxin